MARTKTYDVTVIHEPDPDRVMEGLRFDEVTYGCECGLVFRKKEAI